MGRGGTVVSQLVGDKDPVEESKGGGVVFKPGGAKLFDGDVLGKGIGIPGIPGGPPPHVILGLEPEGILKHGPPMMGGSVGHPILIVVLYTDPGDGQMQVELEVREQGGGTVGKTAPGSYPGSNENS